MSSAQKDIAMNCRKIIGVSQSNVRKAMRFGLIGLLVTSIHFLVAIILIEQILAPPPLANGIAFLFATAISYFANTVWSFSSRLSGKTLFRFIFVSVIGLMLAVIVSVIAQEIGLGYLFGICAVAMIVPPMTFVLHNFWTYR